VHAFTSLSGGDLIDETTRIAPELAIGEYGKSKAEATLSVLEAANSGLDAVIVCPAGIVGPFDYRKSRMGRVLAYFMRGTLFGLPDGAYNFVDVRDIAQGEILAAEQGKSGELYILSGERIEVEELARFTVGFTGRKSYSFPLPIWVCKVAAAFGSAYYNVTGKEPLLTAESLAILRSNCNMSCAKAEREISYRHRPLRETLKDTIRWLTPGKALKYE
jgi:dihydroflavonol-4-reductase